jgi:hypothetical protein
MKKFTITNSNGSTPKQPITERIKSFEDACKILGLNTTILNAEFHNDLDGEAKAAIAFLKLLVITKALNEGWTPDWDNDNEYKYYQWWNMQNGFSLVIVLRLLVFRRVFPPLLQNA